MTTISLQNIQCTCGLLEYFLNTQKAQVATDKKQIWTRKLYAYFAFSLIWGFASSFQATAHRQLDVIFRSFFTKLQIPKVDTVFQYFYKPKEIKFRHIQSIVPEFEFSADASYFQLFVPTVDSVCYTLLLDKLVKSNRKALVTGKTGVGKSKLVA